ncbi:hypothetical protein AT15_08205 [Kosmotoga arenicorallina S304]|uniref:Phosphate transport regulator n=1 Tax=Kosmotoga arenicorallina S304 TaxID=1453497 RepID=A0A176K1Q1_9BACT|nr:DUF47 family protein [Kosmotoga arenicorallina]OAA30953.1 hypothetical protein AT15_08205 [Kosmotoga arenicorallina S304]
MTRLIEKLFPKESPLKLLREHSDIVLEAAAYLPKATKDYFEGKSVEKYSYDVEKLEKRADLLKTKLRMSYEKFRFAFFDRSDVMAILHKQDSVIDGIDDVLKILRMNQVEEIEKTEIPNLFNELCSSVYNSVKLMHELIGALTLIVESAFSPEEVKKEYGEIDILENLEFKSDTESVHIGEILFSLKKKLNPVDIFFLVNLAITISNIADNAENVAESIAMILKSE